MTETPNLDSNFVNVLDNLYSISEGTLNTFNKEGSQDVLSVYNLAAEFLKMFLDIPGRRGLLEQQLISGCVVKEANMTKVISKL